MPGKFRKLKKVIFSGAVILLLGAMLMANSFPVQSGQRGVTVEEIEKQGVKIWVDKGCGSIYQLGELLQVHVESERSGYLTIFDFMPDGNIQIIYPNKYHQDNYVQADVEHTIPTYGDPFQFRLSPPRGEETLLAVVTEDKRELIEEDYSQFTRAFPSLKGTHQDVIQQILRGVEVIPSEVWWAADSCTFCIGGPCGQNNWALIVGIEDYVNKSMVVDGRRIKFGDLHYAVDDAESMQKLLGPKFKNIKVLTNSQATYSNIKNAFTNWLTQAGPDDVVLFYFSGHGSYRKDLSGDEDDGQDEVLVPYDAPDIGKFILDDQIATWLSQLQARAVFISDSCHAGTVHKNVRTFTFIPGSKATISLSDSIGSDLPGSGTKGAGKIISLEASRPNESSVESSKLKHGVFTYFLIEGLQGAADQDNNDKISAQEACRYAKEKVSDYTDYKQHPMCKDYLGEEVYLTG